MPFPCSGQNCQGQISIDQNHSVPLPKGCASLALAFPCSLCGRLHWEDGDPVIHRADNRYAYLIDGLIKHKGEAPPFTY
jgi:hypothetical protein